MNAIEKPIEAGWTRAERERASHLPPGDWNRADWQRLWLATQSRPWNTLAVVAGERDISTLEVASLITTLGLNFGESLGLVDISDVDLNRVAPIIELTEQVVAAGSRVVFAARSISENLATIPLARACDCVILCVTLGSTTVAMVEEAVAQIGKERFLGSLLVKGQRPDPGGPSISPIRRRLEASA
jgi:hypothetical protein